MDAGTGGARTNGVATYGEENWKRVWDMGLKSHWRGVSWNKRKRTWQAVHRADGVLRSVPCACERDAALMYNELVVRYQHNKLDDDSGVELLVAQVSCLLCTVTFYANLAHSLTRSPSHL